MEIINYATALSLLLFAILAMFDGVYLHLWKLELFNHQDSQFEHKTHTIRAILFPLIVWLLFIQKSELSLWVGIILVGLDMIVLAIDAWSEKDSRKSIGGLPRWEYIIHLFSNGFHFGAISLILVSRFIDLNGTDDTIILEVIAKNLIPGAILLALIHLLLISKKGVAFWNLNRAKIKCC